ncbi:MAG: AI-2E family transporter [Actinomycetota bacterium]
MVTPAAPRLPAGERLRRAGIAAWSVIGLLILVAISFWLLLKIRVIFPPLLIALLIIYMLNPLVTRLERRRVPRTAGTIVTFLLAIGVFALILILLVPAVSNQVSSFSEEWPRFRTQMASFVIDTTESIDKRFGTNIDSAQIACLFDADQTIEGADAPTPAQCDEVTRKFRDQLGQQAGRITEIGLTVLEVLLVFILAPLVALYLLIDLPQLQRDMLNLVPETHRAEAADLASKVGRTVGGFFRGQLVVALIVGVLSAIGFRIIGLPFWLVIGAIAGFFNLIPLVGPYIGGTLGFLVGTVSGGVGLGLRAALVELIVQQLDNHFISPNVMKRTVNLHPVTVMLSILAGGAVAGFWGILLGVPAVAVGKLVLGHLWATRVLGEEVSPYATTKSEAGEPPSVVPESAKS